MYKYLMELNDPQAIDPAAAGGKGAGLAELSRAGQPVPAAVILSTAAYRLFLEKNGIDTGSDPSKIRLALLDGTFPEEVLAELTEWYRSQGTDIRLAVRSSATAEDLKEASFAGQQETFLNVSGSLRLEEKVRACYASLWNDRAVSYRQEHGFGDSSPAMAVVLQQMIESEVSGVLFTVDPADGSPEVVINASYGLGEAVVSGAVTPDEYRCYRSGLVKEYTVGSKEQKMISGRAGTKNVPVPAILRSRRTLSDERIRELVRCSLEIEAACGYPVDIEWAFDDGKLSILQARRITSLEDLKIPDYTEDQIPEIRPVSGRVRKSMLFFLEKQTMASYPLDFDFSSVIVHQKTVILQENGVQTDLECSMDQKGFETLPQGKTHISSGLRSLPATVLNLGRHDRNRTSAYKILYQEQQNLLKIQQQELSSLQLKECGDSFRSLLSITASLSHARFLYAVYPAYVMTGSLEKPLKKVDPSLTAYDLLSGLSFKTADISRDLARLAAEISDVAALKRCVLSGKSYEEIIGLFPRAVPMFEKFLSSSGFRSDYSLYCFTARNWYEDRERLLQVLRPLLRSSKPPVTPEEGEKRYLELVEAAKSHMNPVSAAKYPDQVKAYRFYHWYREETQYLLETVFYFCRLLLARTAELLKGRISSKEDLLFLFKDELLKVCDSGILDDELLEKLEERKSLRPAAEEYWRRQQWEVLRGTEVREPEEGDMVRGISGSPGQARGPARVITCPAQFDKLQPGDILVCHYTDPEWTSLFPLAAGIISDTGGSLSHAAIVAREYGIPALLAAGTATSFFRDGDPVFLDGTAGTAAKEDSPSKE